MNQKYNLFSWGLLPMFVILAGVQGCSTLPTAASNDDEKTWESMAACGEEAAGNPLKAKCDERFKNSPVSAKLDKVRLNYGSIDLDLVVTESTYRARHLTCSLEGPTAKDRAAKLTPGDLVKVQGTMHQIYKSVYFTDIVLSPCALLN